MRLVLVLFIVLDPARLNLRSLYLHHYMNKGFIKLVITKFEEIYQSPVVLVLRL